MSERSGLGNKGEKNQGKFKGIDINNIYKGTSVTQQKSAPVRNQQHGLQVLGKVASIRRMPPPANLPSLKSEAGGNDPFINLVPTSNTGWKEEKSLESGGSLPRSSQPLPVTGQSQEPITRRQTPTDGAQQQQQQHQQQPPAHGVSGAGGPLWSSVTSGVKKQGGFLDQNSPHFLEEFPQLAAGSEEKIATSKKEEESKESQYGPGPSLRPQNMASWREGGCIGAAVQQSSTSSQLQQPPPSPGLASTADSSTLESAKPQPPSHMMMQGPMRPPMAGMHPPPPPPPPPPHMGQVPMMPHPYRAMMMPPFAFRPGYPPHFPQNFVHPGMQRPPFMGSDFRFRGMPPQMVTSMRPELGEESSHDRPPVVKDRDLEQFDRLELSDGAWARPAIDLDYSERLVFSDEEDNGLNTKSDRGKLMRSTSEGERERKKSSETDREENYQKLVGSRDRDKARTEGASNPEAYRDWIQSGEVRSASSPGSGPPKEAWMAQGQRPWPPGGIPFDKHGAPVGFHPMAQFAQRPAFHPSKMAVGQRGGVDGDDDEMWRQRRKQQSEEMAIAIERARQRRLEEERKMKEDQMAAAKEKLRQLDEKLAKKEDKSKLDSTSENNESGETSGSSGQENNDRSRTANGKSSSSSGANKGAMRLPPRFQKSPSYHSGDEPSSLIEKDIDVPTGSELTSSCSSLEQSQLMQRSSSPLGHMMGSAQGQKQPGSPHGCQPPQHPVHGVPRMPGMGYWSYDPRWGPMAPSFMMDPRMGPRPPFDPATGMPMHMPVRWPIKEKEEGSLESDQKGPEYYYNRRAWSEQRAFLPPQGGDDHMMRGSGILPPYYGYPLDLDQRSYMEHLDKRDRNLMMPYSAFGFREGSEPRDEESSDGELNSCQRNYRRHVSEVNSAKDCDEELNRHGSFSSKNSDRGSAVLSHKDAPPPSELSSCQEETKSVARSKEICNKQDNLGSEQFDVKSRGRDEPGEKNTNLTDDGRKTKQEKQLRNMDRKESQRQNEKQTEHSYRPKNSSRYHDKDSRDFRPRSGSPVEPHPNDQRSSCPPPVTLQQNLPVNSSYTSLKRTHSNISNSSVNSTERKTGSPSTVARSGGLLVESQKSVSRESVKSSSEFEIKSGTLSISRDLKTSDTIIEKTDVSKSTPAEAKSKSDKDDSKSGVQQEALAVTGIEKTELRKGEKSIDRPPSKKLKDSSKRLYSRRREDHHDSERNRTGQGSREFVRGGRGKAYGYGGRGRSGGGRDHDGGYGLAHEGLYDAELERYGIGSNESELKTLEEDAGGKQFHADGRWGNTQNKGASKDGGPRNRVRSRGQRSARGPDEKSLQDSFLLGNEKSGDLKTKSTKQCDLKEPVAAAAASAGAAAAESEKDAVKQEQSTKNLASKDVDLVSKREPPRQNEGHGSNRNHSRRGGSGTSGGGSSGGIGGGGGGGSFYDPPYSGRGGLGPKQENQQQRGPSETNQMGHTNNRTKEDSRYDRSGPTPPRFANNDGRHGSNYGYGDRRHRGSSGRGQGRMNHHGGRNYKDQSNKKPPSSEYNEEWETASEGSDNLSCNVHSKKEQNRDISSTGDKQESKKSFSNQRRGPRRRGNHGNPPSNTAVRSQVSSAGMINSGSSSEKGADQQPPTGSEAQENPAKSNIEAPTGSNGTVHPVYRLDEVIYNDPQLIQRAMSSASRRCKWNFMDKMPCESEKLTDFYQDTMSDITSFWRSDEKEYNGNRFSRNNLIFTGSHFKKNKVHGFKQQLPPRFARLHSIKKQQQLDEDWPRCNNEDWFPWSLYHPPVTMSALALAVDVHMYSGERHDSGVDMSEPPNSLVSSCRSSPCNGEDILLRRLNKSSYLDFTFDDEFSCMAESTQIEDDGASFDGGSAVEEDMQKYMSKATDNLGMKITSVRNVWNSKLSSDSEKDQQFASDKMRYAMLSECLTVQSPHDWAFDRKESAAASSGTNQSEGSCTTSGAKVPCSAQVHESLSAKRRGFLPRGSSDDSLPAKTDYGNRFFPSSFSDYPCTNSEVWKKSPNKSADGTEKSGFVLPHMFGPLISVLTRPEHPNLVPVTRGTGISSGSGVIGSHRGQQRNAVGSSRSLLSSPVLGQPQSADSFDTAPGSAYSAESSESDQDHASMKLESPAGESGTDCAYSSRSDGVSNCQGLQQKESSNSTTADWGKNPKAMEEISESTKTD